MVVVSCRVLAAQACLSAEAPRSTCIMTDRDKITFKYSMIYMQQAMIRRDFSKASKILITP